MLFQSWRPDVRVGILAKASIKDSIMASIQTRLSRDTPEPGRLGQRANGALARTSRPPERWKPGASRSRATCRLQASVPTSRSLSRG